MKIKGITFIVILILVGFSACVRHEVLPEDDTFTGWVAGDPYDGYGTILKSGDNGLNWYRQGSVSQIPTVKMNDVSAMDQNSVWAVGNTLNGYGMIMYSANGGLTWARQGTDSLLHKASLLSVYAKAGTRVWVCGEKGKLLYSDDKGINWNPVRMDTLSTAKLSGISVFNNHIWVIGNISDTAGNDSVSVILHSSDGGFQFSSSGPHGLVHLTSVFALNDTLVFLTAGTSIYRTRDGGNNWTVIFNSVNGNICDICATSEGNIWAAGEQGRAFRSTDGGITWALNWPQSGKYTLNKISLFDTARIWICGSGNFPTRQGVLYYSNNAGKTWFIGTLNVDAGIRGLTFVKGIR